MEHPRRGPRAARRRGRWSASIRRFLTGSARRRARRPARIGSSMSPAARRPRRDRAGGGPGIGGGNAVFVGGAWYAINGWLTWALGELDGVVPRAGAYALRRARAQHAGGARARLSREHWNGDPVGRRRLQLVVLRGPRRTAGSASTTPTPARSCTSPPGRSTRSPGWPGSGPPRAGYRFAPSLPLRSFSLRLPNVGVAVRRGLLRGYVRPQPAGRCRSRWRSGAA